MSPRQKWGETGLGPSMVKTYKKNLVTVEIEGRHAAMREGSGPWKAVDLRHSSVGELVVRLEKEGFKAVE